jgi:hypothetical protein
MGMWRLRIAHKKLFRSSRCGRFSIFPFYAAGATHHSNLYAAMNTLPTSIARRSVMFLHFVAGVDFPNQLPTATAPCFLLGRKLSPLAAGRLFRPHEAAIR